MSTRWSFGGSLLASLCCVGPAVAALIGVGSASALVGLSRYRLPLLAVGLLITGAGVFLTLKRLRTTCSPDEYKKRQWQVPVTTLAVFAFTYGVLTYGFPTLVYRSLTPRAAAQTEAQVPANPMPQIEAAEEKAPSTGAGSDQATMIASRYRAVLQISGMT